MSKSPIRSAVFLGSKPFGLAILKTLIAAEPALDWVILHPDDVSDPRSNYPAYQAFAAEVGIELKRVANRAEAERALSERPYDVGFVCGWYWLFGDRFVGAEASPLYGIHNSLLPRYRGGAPLVWSIINGEPEVGGSLFRLTPRMDDGDIVLQVKVPVKQDSTIADLLGDIEAAFLRKLPKVWADIVSGQANLIQQDHEMATFCAQRRPEDGEIDWLSTAQDVHNFIRGQSSPYPCAFTFCADTKIFIDAAYVFSGQYFGRPGQIVERKPEFVTVTTGSGGAIRITDAHDLKGEKSLQKLFRAKIRVLGNCQENTLS